MRATPHPFAVLFDKDTALPRAQVTQLRLAPGEALFDQADFDDRLYILDQGLLEVSVLSASGRKLSLNQMGPGSVFGEIAILDPGPRTARVAALKASELRALPQKALFAALAEAPDLALELLQLAGQRMRWMSQQVEEQIFLPPAARLASKMLHLQDARGDVRMSQEQLANFVGVTRELVSKTLATWQRAGIVRLSRGRVQICDADRLEDLRAADEI